MVGNTYFNTKVNVTNGEERILAYMLMGFTWEMLHHAVTHGNIKGLHPDITLSLLQRFATKWGKTSDIVQMAHPNMTGNQKGYTYVKENIKVGRAHADFFSARFNERSDDTATPIQQCPTPTQEIAVTRWRHCCLRQYR
jgi:hypothetical protein